MRKVEEIRWKTFDLLGGLNLQIEEGANGGQRSVPITDVSLLSASHNARAPLPCAADSRLALATRTKKEIGICI